MRHEIILSGCASSYVWMFHVVLVALQSSTCGYMLLVTLKWGENNFGSLPR